MNRRMNLFRQLQGPIASPIKRVSLSPHLLGALGIAAIVLVTLVSGFVKHRSMEKLVRARISSAERQLEGLGQAGEAKAARRVASENEMKPVSSVLDGTWSALLWKLSTYSARHVVVNRMDLSPGGLGKQIVIEGEAKSLQQVREWIEGLGSQLPGFDFTMENQTRTADLNLPVQFRITGRSL